MRAIYLLLTFVLAYKCKANIAKDDKLIVESREGQILGFQEQSLQDKTFYSFTSIPFAKPPIGKLRFKSPVPMDPWEGLMNATEPLHYCIQYTLQQITRPDFQNAFIEGSEDCLYLNVHTPKPNDVDANLPVMVWIHGGGFFFGSGLEYPPYVMMEKDIVLVTIQYRLNVFGFLSTEDSQLPGNLGLRDQQLALKWVQKNIKQFGGDPSSVTLFGQSAGAASIHMHILSPGSKGLFHRVIMQSGSVLCPWAFVEEHRAFTKELGNALGCPLDEENPSFVECLQSLPAEAMLQFMIKSLTWGFNQLYVLPRVDGEVIPERPEILIKEGRYNKVDMISGVTKDEGALQFAMVSGVPQMLLNLNENFTRIAPVALHLLHEGDPSGLATQIFQHYLGRPDVTVGLRDSQNVVKLLSDRYISHCHDMSVLLHSEDTALSVYQYEMDYRGQLSMTDLFMKPGVRKWVGHMDDLIYLFSGGPLFSRNIESEDDLRMRKRILDLWTNFAKTGNPTPKGYDITWEKVTPETLKHLKLRPLPKMAEDNRGDIRKFWASLNTKQMKNILPHPLLESSSNRIEFISTMAPLPIIRQETATTTTASTTAIKTTTTSETTATTKKIENSGKPGFPIIIPSNLPKDLNPLLSIIETIKKILEIKIEILEVISKKVENPPNLQLLARSLGTV